MLLIFAGPSCSGKSTAARLLADRTGADVWSGKDYLRLARNEADAWEVFTQKLNMAASVRDLAPGSLIYVVTPSPGKNPELPVIQGSRVVKFIADQPALESRFAPRVGGRMSPPISTMISRSLEATRQLSAELTVDTTAMDTETVVDAILKALSD